MLAKENLIFRGGGGGGGEGRGGEGSVAFGRNFTENWREFWIGERG